MSRGPSLRLPRLTIAGKVVVLLVLIVAGVTAVTAVLSARAVVRRIDAELRAAAERRAAHLAIALRQPFYSFDVVTVEALARAELEDADVAGVLAEFSELKVGMARVDGRVQRTTALAPQPGMVAAEREVVQPGDGGGPPTPLGRVSVAFSPARARAQQAAHVRERIVEALTMTVVLGLAVSILLYGALVRPLERLRAELVRARELLARGRPEALEAVDPVAGIRGAFSELRSMGRHLQSTLAAVRESQSVVVEREEDLRTTLDAIGDGVIAVDAAGRVRRLNPAAERLTAWTQGDALGAELGAVFEALPAAEGDGAIDLLARSLASGEPVSSAEPFRLRARTGEERWVAANASPIPGPTGAVSGAVLVFRDVSRQRELEERLRHSQKMDAIGQLAGGIAHDFNNMLTPILAYAQMIRDDPGVSHDVRGFAEIVAETAGRAAGLTRQLLAFSRQGTQAKRMVEPDRLVQETIGLLARTFDRRIEIVTDLRARTCIDADPALVQNALINLAVNARDAMPQGGRLTFATRVVTLDARDCAIPGYTPAPGSFVEVSVSDTGHGMPPETLKRIFEPFFTTKEVGRGTGLGLSAVYGTMREHDGAATVASEEGRGSTFRLYFPVCRDASTSTPAPAAPAPFRGAGRVLVVEDEPRVREIITLTLRDAGFSVLEAASGTRARELLASDPGPIRAVVLDLVLPGAHGREVLAAIRARAPALPVLVCSGYPRDTTLSDLLADPRCAYLSKPFRSSELLEALRKLLAGVP